VGLRTTAGSYLVTVTVPIARAYQQTASQQFNHYHKPSTLAVTCSAPLSGTVGTPYFLVHVHAQRRHCSLRLELSGTIPPGYPSNSSTGVVSGTPTTAGSYPVTVNGQR